MTAAKATKTSPLADFFSGASDTRKREVYSQVIGKAIASQLQVEAKAKVILSARCKEKASA